MSLLVQVPMKCFEGRWDGKRCSKVGEHWENFSAEVLPSGGQKRDQFAVEVEIEILSRKKRHFGEIFPLFALHLAETLRKCILHFDKKCIESFKGFYFWTY